MRTFRHTCAVSHDKEFSKGREKAIGNVSDFQFAFSWAREKAKGSDFRFAFSQAGKKQNCSDFQFAFSRADFQFAFSRAGKKQNGPDFQFAFSRQKAQTSNLLFPGPGKGKMVQISNLLFPNPGKSNRKSEEQLFLQRGQVTNMTCADLSQDLREPFATAVRAQSKSAFEIRLLTRKRWVFERRSYNDNVTHKALIWKRALRNDTHCHR